MTKNLFVLVLSSLAFVAGAQAAPFTVTDQATGTQYQCGTGGGTGGDPAERAACVSDLTSWCNSNTSYTSTQCYDKLSAARGCGLNGYAACVKQTASYCNSNTSYTMTQCFDRAMPACAGGSFTNLAEIMEGVREKSFNAGVQKAKAPVSNSEE